MENKRNVKREGGVVRKGKKTVKKGQGTSEDSEEPRTFNPTISKF